MELLGGQLVLSPSDLVRYVTCAHLSMLEFGAASGLTRRPQIEDPELDLLAQLGFANEAEHLERLKASGATVVELAAPQFHIDALYDAHEETLNAMQAGVDVIYQPTFFDGRWVGRADFLLRVPLPSDLGAYSYEVADAKLAKQSTPTAVLQLCAYSDWLSDAQSVLPEQIHLLLGDRSTTTLRTRDFIAYYRRLREEMTSSLVEQAPTYPDLIPHCEICRWRERCAERREADDHLSLVAGIRRDQITKLTAAGISTLSALGTATATALPSTIQSATAARLAQQARLQLEGRTNPHRYDLLAPTPGRGLALLPEPDEGDVFLDIESDPFTDPDGLDYLFGYVQRTGRTPSYFALWAKDFDSERHAFEALIDLLIDVRSRHPLMHVFHYGAYEQSRLQRLLNRHPTRQTEIDLLLREHRFVNLHEVVSQGLRASVDSYSLKALEEFYGYQRTSSVRDGASSFVYYRRWADTGDVSLLADIADYNAEDCYSTLALRDWLEQLRDQANQVFAVAPLSDPSSELMAELGLVSEAVPRPQGVISPQEGDTDGPERRELIDALLGGVSVSAGDRRPPDQARWLLAHLLDWHWRELRVDLQEEHRRDRMTSEELVEDGASLAGLRLVGQVADGSIRYSFEPRDQDYKLRAGDTVHQPGPERRAAGEVLSVDPQSAAIVLGRGTIQNHQRDPFTSLTASTVHWSQTQRDALIRLAEFVAASGVEGRGRFKAARDLLMRTRPTLTTGVSQLRRQGETAIEAGQRLVLELDDSTLAVQGPPGSGKTYLAALMILDLFDRGDVVGITGPSHKAICRLIEETILQAGHRGMPLRIVQKVTRKEQAFRHDYVTPRTKNANIDEAVSSGGPLVVAGTSYLFSRPQMVEKLNVLLIDEAGQVGLADTLAAAMAAKNVVLLGDPQQLDQPTRGAHPQGTNVSGLAHVIGPHATIEDSMGIFIEETRRLHPDVCAFISEIAYDGKLVPHAISAARVMGAGVGLGGTGLRYVPVASSGNRRSSEDEGVVVAVLARLLRGTAWQDGAGREWDLESEDMLMVAPYNAHLNVIASFLPPGSRVGTVDRFQGQEAPIVFYSLATSDPSDAPRGLEFLYSLNRLNVAISRAQALAFLVCSPSLLTARCATVDQMRLVNALCRFVELAEELPAPPPEEWRPPSPVLD